MDALEFLRAVWPATGIYCLAYPSSGKGYAHRTFTTIEAAAAFVPQLAADRNVFFAVHTLKAHRVWNEHARRDKDTKEWVADYSYRLQTNMHACKCFFFDLDVGKSTSTLVKYETQRAALADLLRFCKVTGLPLPLVTSSGGGIHAYWLLQDEILSNEWAVHADNLFALARHHNLHVDASRTTDTSSVLRVVGSDNLKGGDRRPCKTLAPGKPTPNEDFLKLLTDALDCEHVAKDRKRKAAPKEDDILGSNIQPDQMPPVTIVQLGKACPQVRAYAAVKGEVGYPHWHMILNVVRHVVDGRDWAHKLSGAPDSPWYDADACDDKMDEQEAKEIGPTTCQVIDQVSGNDICKTCFWWGKVKSPMVSARWPQKAKEKPAEPASAPEPEPGAPEPEPEPERHPTPKGFYLTDDGCVAQWRKNKEGVEYPHVILRHDLYPSMRQVDTGAEIDQHEWNTKLPLEKPKTFMLESGVIQQDKTLAVALSKQGVYVFPDNVKSVQTYMSAYTQDLLAAAKAEVQQSRLGWTDEDRTTFVLFDKILHADGSITKTTLSSNTEYGLVTERGIGRKGTLSGKSSCSNFTTSQSTPRTSSTSCAASPPRCSLRPASMV